MIVNIKKHIVQRYIKDQGILSKVIFIGVSIVVFGFFLSHAENSFEKENAVISDIVESIRLEDGEIYNWTFDDVGNLNIKGINILFDTYGQEKQGIIHITLYENGVKKESWDRDVSMLFREEHQQFLLEKMFTTDSMSKYEISVSENYSADNGVAIKVDENGKLCCSLVSESKLEKRIVLFIAVLFFLFVVIYILMEKKEFYLMSFLLIFFVFAYLLLLPPYMSPDEGGHFLRAYQIAEGGWISPHMNLKYSRERGGSAGIYEAPSGLYEFTENPLQATIDNADRVKDSWMFFAMYFPSAYLPHAIGILVARIFSNRVMDIFMVGRICGALVNIIICIYAFYIVPFGRRLLFLALMTPMSLQLLGAICPDGFLISLGMLFLAYILHLSYRSNAVTLKDIIILTVVGVMIALCKIAYIEILLLLLLIPDDKFYSKKYGRQFKVGVILLGTILALVWTNYVSNVYIYEMNPGVDQKAQVSFIFTNVFEYCSIVFEFINNAADSLLFCILGNAMGAYNVETVSILWITLFALFVYEICHCYDTDREIHKYDIYILCAVFLIGIALTITSIYMLFSSVGSHIIFVQGRYFMPLLGTFLIGASLLRRNYLNSRGVDAVIYEQGTYCYVFLLFCNGLALLDIIHYGINASWWG